MGDEKRIETELAIFAALKRQIGEVCRRRGISFQEAVDQALANWVEETEAGPNVNDLKTGQLIHRERTTS